MDVSGISSASVATAAQIKVHKGAVKQQEAVIMKLLQSTTETIQSTSPSSTTGQKLNVTA